MIVPRKTVMTIGHSKHSTEKFLDLLRMHAVDAVADVRSSPFSRFNPQYNRETLKKSLTENSIRYVFLGNELGARSRDPACYVNGKVSYTLLSQSELFQSGITRILQGAFRYRIALMCAEKEPLECHRTILVAKALVEKSIPVLHIHGNGALESHEAAMDRLLDITGLPKKDFFRSKQELLSEALQRQEQIIAYVEEKPDHQHEAENI